MDSNQGGGSTNGRELRPFEKNNYFHGKLMTARDMQAEQDYHAGRQDALTRLVTGEGIVRGLTVTEVRERNDRLEATVEDGVALDCYGRPIVVTGAESVPVTRSGSDQPSAPDEDVIYLSLGYKELDKESVPVPGSESARDVTCAPNRFLETFDIIYDESPPDRYKPVPSVEFPDKDDVRSADESVLGEIARWYYDDLQRSETRDDPSLFLGAFERDEDGWTETSKTERRPLVYTNDMLYAAIVRHVTDFDDPHEVSGIEETTGGIAERLTALERYVMERSLRFTVRSFSTVEERFGADTADEIVDVAREAINADAPEDEGRYFDFVEHVADSERTLAGDLEDGGEITNDSLERYREALDELEAALAERTLLQVAVAQDVVCESADLLRRRKPIKVPITADVPDLIGMSKEDAEKKLVEDNWRYLIERREGRDEDRDEGFELDDVVEQRPAPGEEVYITHRVIEVKVRGPMRFQGE